MDRQSKLILERLDYKMDVNSALMRLEGVGLQT